MVFKKDLTPIGGKRGKIVKHAGKGSAPMAPPGGMPQRSFAKPPPGPPAGPPAGPPGMMPPFGIGQPPEE